jgi:hypothetical protein
MIIAVMLSQSAYKGARSWRLCRTTVVRKVVRLSDSVYLHRLLRSKLIYLLHMHHTGLASALIVRPMVVASCRYIGRPSMRMNNHFSSRRQNSFLPGAAGFRPNA